jgi:hypothetical protein
VAAVLPGENDSRIVDLSWSINVENDLAGYRVYRSEKQGERGQLLQTELLASPAFRDSSCKPGTATGMRSPLSIARATKAKFPTRHSPILHSLCLEG